MPLYEYRCEQCGEAFEQLASPGKKDAKVACPKCASKRTTRQFSSFAIGSAKSTAKLPSCATGACSTGTCPYVAE